MKKRFQDVEETTVCNLEVMVMPNGEVLCCGKSLFFLDDKDYEIRYYLEKKND